MNMLLLQPTDVLFFRDGRPMNGSLAGHTAAWPLPDVTNHALHAALHRAGLDGVHAHRRGRSGQYSENAEHRDRKFGSLSTAGPFPVYGEDRWFFPRPKDAQANGSVEVTLRPARLAPQAGNDHPWPGSSLPNPLKYAVANTRPPEKEAGGEPWISADAFSAYLQGHAFADAAHFLRDECIADKEASLGIAIDPDTQTAGQGDAAGQIYTAHYLRLREGFRLGMFAEAMDKMHGDKSGKCDLLKILLNGHPAQIVVGGQQRICTTVLTTRASLPIPHGLTDGFNTTTEKADKRWLVKWILLSLAVWPEIPAMKKDGTAQNPHPGGWLPNWVFVNSDSQKGETVPYERNGRVLLTTGPGVRKSQRTHSIAGRPIAARLVAAIVPKPLVVTGWALPSAANPQRAANGGAKSTHLAVPAGAVYYFEAYSGEDAVALATALNWHGETKGAEIKNRRSTLLGEKGYGLGVCGTWKPFGDVP